jgi:Xaa-Pro aminopeptidase
MRYQKIDPKLFISNRKELINNLLPNSLAVFHSNDIISTNGDGTMGFIQNSDLFYLSGIYQEQTILLVYIGNDREQCRELLFIKSTDEISRIWDGPKYSKEQAKSISGIYEVYWLDDFYQLFKSLAFEANSLYLNTNENVRANLEVKTRQDRFISWCKKKYPLHKYERVAPILKKLRTVKSTYELNLIKEACKITHKGFMRVINYLKPGLWEYNIEAEFIHEFITHGSGGFAYQPIIASGANACILHYIHNNCLCKSGDLVLLDVGAEYAHYNADVTRTVPINGIFTDRQKQVYNSVLKIHNYAISLLSPGLDFKVYNKEIAKFVESELITLKLFDKHDIKNQSTDAPLYKKFFMHSVSHHLGLDVHDIGQYDVMKPGMVVTVEPGIYIQEEGIGIRLEDDIFIHSDGSIENLTKDIPITVEELEWQMQHS